ncbi:MAG: L-glutamate gamma-semialdehyde dehydrogenase, partial [Chloroflexi bacterium]|nr:L-glutamate gamma-semialdehyde dehydrogenase [Chloroflexota bacterium]
AGPAEVRAAIDAAAAAWPAWSEATLAQRAAVFRKAADLLAGPWRARLNAATMLNQSKTAHQAEIDSAAELCDFWRFNADYAERISDEQPISVPGVRNELDYRPLEGFVLAVSPFNFTSIAGNLPTAPALMGNTVVWKPASSASLSAHVIMAILRDAGLPDGVVNLVFGSGGEVGTVALADERLAGLHFTGSTAVFDGLWRDVGARLDSYRTYPRLVGETGGKNFVIAHPSADPAALATAVIRGAFEYQGQKCSAASRVYVPESLWPGLRERLAADIATIRVGDVADFSNFMGAVIDEAAYARLTGAIAEARAYPGSEIVIGGGADKSEGWFVQPTVVLAHEPSFRLLRDELFGPIVTVYVYPDRAYAETLALIDRGTRYGLTGAVFARDERVIAETSRRLRGAAGNFYVNDKPTGAVVAQQPFGGARRSGTNDKAGSIWNLIRWTSPRAIKTTAEPPTDYRYPFMAPDAR